jgi:hypothetical protein
LKKRGKKESDFDFREHSYNKVRFMLASGFLTIKGEENARWVKKEFVRNAKLPPHFIQSGCTVGPKQVKIVEEATTGWVSKWAAWNEL